MQRKIEVSRGIKVIFTAVLSTVADCDDGSGVPSGILYLAVNGAGYGYAEYQLALSLLHAARLVRIDSNVIYCTEAGRKTAGEINALVMS